MSTSKAKLATVLTGILLTTVLAPSIVLALPPLRDVQTRIETSGSGKRVYLKVYDPSREQWMEESFYDDDIWGLISSDGVVAWKACVDHVIPKVEHIEVRATHLGLGISAQVFRIIARRLRA